MRTKKREAPLRGKLIEKRENFLRGKEKADAGISRYVGKKKRSPLPRKSVLFRLLSGGEGPREMERGEERRQAIRAARRDFSDREGKKPGRSRKEIGKNKVKRDTVGRGGNR